MVRLSCVLRITRRPAAAFWGDEFYDLCIWRCLCDKTLVDVHLFIRYASVSIIDKRGVAGVSVGICIRFRISVLLDLTSDRFSVTIPSRTIPARTKQISIIRDAIRYVLRRAMGMRQRKKIQSKRETASGTGYIASM